MREIEALLNGKCWKVVKIELKQILQKFLCRLVKRVV